MFFFFAHNLVGQQIMTMQTTGQKFNVVVVSGTQVYLADSNAYYKITCRFGPMHSMRNVFARGCYTLISGGGVSTTLWQNESGGFISPKNDKNVKLSDTGSVYFGDDYIKKSIIYRLDSVLVRGGDDLYSISASDSTGSLSYEAYSIVQIGDEITFWDAVKEQDCNSVTITDKYEDVGFYWIKFSGVCFCDVDCSGFKLTPVYDTVGITYTCFEPSKPIKLPDTALYRGTYPLRLLNDSLQIKIDDAWKNIKLEDRAIP